MTTTLEAQVSDAEWRTALVDESRTYEVFPAMRRAALIADYLGPTIAVGPVRHPFAVLRDALTKDVGGTVGGGKSLHVHAAILAALANQTAEDQP